MAEELDPFAVYRRGLRDPEELNPAERLVYVTMELETYADMEGWDHFFTTDKSRYLAELKQGLRAAGDSASVAVIESYESHLEEHGVSLADLDEFLVAQSDEYFKGVPDWRLQFSELAESRWLLIAQYLRAEGYELLTTSAP